MKFPGVKAAFGKIPHLPTAEVFLDFAKGLK